MAKAKMTRKNQQRRLSGFGQRKISLGEAHRQRLEAIGAAEQGRGYTEKWVKRSTRKRVAGAKRAASRSRRSARAAAIESPGR